MRERLEETRASGPAARTTLYAVLGMQRSGKSTVAWMLIDRGVALGREPGPAGALDRRGRIEDPELTQLHKRILRRSGGSARRPPPAVELIPRDRRQRNAILRSYDPPTAVLEDPRMLLVADLWRDLPLRRIGVLRNPADVADAMLSRWRANVAAKDRPLDRDRCEELWIAYNRALLAELEREVFPLVDFDRRAELGAQVDVALRFHGWAPNGRRDEGRHENGPDAAEGWRARVSNPAAVALWEELAARTLPSLRL